MAGGSRYTASSSQTPFYYDKEVKGSTPPPPPPGPPPGQSYRQQHQDQSTFFTSNATPMEDLPQLRNQRHQWDAQRDIAPGRVSDIASTVFGAKSDPPPPPPPGPPPSFNRPRQFQETAPSFNLVEERRKAAQAVYESDGIDDSYLDEGAYTDENISFPIASSQFSVSSGRSNGSGARTPSIPESARPSASGGTDPWHLPPGSDFNSTSNTSMRSSPSFDDPHSQLMSQETTSSAVDSFPSFDNSPFDTNTSGTERASPTFIAADTPAARRRLKSSARNTAARSPVATKETVGYPDGWGTYDSKSFEASPTPAPAPVPAAATSENPPLVLYSSDEYDTDDGDLNEGAQKANLVRNDVESIKKKWGIKSLIRKASSKVPSSSSTSSRSFSSNKSSVTDKASNGMDASGFENTGKKKKKSPARSPKLAHSAEVDVKKPIPTKPKTTVSRGSHAHSSAAEQSSSPTTFTPIFSAKNPSTSNSSKFTFPPTDTRSFADSLISSHAGSNDLVKPSRLIQRLERPSAEGKDTRFGGKGIQENPSQGELWGDASVVSEMTDPTYFRDQKSNDPSNIPRNNSEKDTFVMKDSTILSGAGGSTGHHSSRTASRVGTPSESESSMEVSESAKPLISDSDGFGGDISVRSAGKVDASAMGTQHKAESFLPQSAKNGMADLAAGATVNDVSDSAMVSAGLQSNWSATDEDNFFTSSEVFSQGKDAFAADNDDETSEDPFFGSQSFSPSRASEIDNDDQLAAGQSFAEDPPLDNVDVLSSDDESASPEKKKYLTPPRNSERMAASSSSYKENAVPSSQPRSPFAQSQIAEKVGPGTDTSIKETSPVQSSFPLKSSPNRKWRYDRGVVSTVVQSKTSEDDEIDQDKLANHSSDDDTDNGGSNFQAQATVSSAASSQAKSTPGRAAVPFYGTRSTANAAAHLRKTSEDGKIHQNISANNSLNDTHEDSYNSQTQTADPSAAASRATFTPGGTAAPRYGTSSTAAAAALLRRARHRNQRVDSEPNDKNDKVEVAEEVVHTTSVPPTLSDIALSMTPRGSPVNTPERKKKTTEDIPLDKSHSSSSPQCGSIVSQLAYKLQKESNLNNSTSQQSQTHNGETGKTKPKAEVMSRVRGGRYARESGTTSDNTKKEEPTSHNTSANIESKNTGTALSARGSILTASDKTKDRVPVYTTEDDELQDTEKLSSPVVVSSLAASISSRLSSTKPMNNRQKQNQPASRESLSIFARKGRGKANLTENQERKQLQNSAESDAPSKGAPFSSVNEHQSSKETLRVSTQQTTESGDFRKHARVPSDSSSSALVMRRSDRSQRKPGYDIPDAPSMVISSKSGSSVGGPSNKSDSSPRKFSSSRFMRGSVQSEQEEKHPEPSTRRTFRNVDTSQPLALPSRPSRNRKKKEQDSLAMVSVSSDRSTANYRLSPKRTKNAGGFKTASTSSTLKHGELTVRRASNSKDSTGVLSNRKKLGTSRNKMLPASTQHKTNEPTSRCLVPSFTDESVNPYLSDITDPIQRAGIRLLSAAAIPIQTEARRYLARNAAVKRFEALITVQKYFRRWISEFYFENCIYSSTRIQAAFRGWLARDNLDDEHYCATQIQRIVRGYLATMMVYEDLYNITVMQSLIRMRLATHEAGHRLACIIKIQTFYRGYIARYSTLRLVSATQIQSFYRGALARDAVLKLVSAIRIQSLFRGYTVRHEVGIMKMCATSIQSRWRTYSAQLNFQFDVVDIIIVQSVFRRQKAYRALQQKRHELEVYSAIVIQSQWRSYDCTLNYLHTMADILIIQSVIRRWSTMRFFHAYRSRIYYDSAMSIQKIVRGIQLRTAVREYRASTTIQKYWRGLVALRDYKDWQASVLEWDSALDIQRVWRGHVIRINYAELKASIQIQRIWRGFQCYTDFIFTMADVVLVQRIGRQWLARRYVVRLKQMREQQTHHQAAADIQRIWRGYKAHMNMLFLLVHIIVAQSVVRRRIATQKYKMLLKEHRTELAEEDGAKKIQSAWRSCYLRWKTNKAATLIQKTWRGFFQYSNYLIMQFEEQAAISIQRCWRGFWQYSHYVILHFEVVRIQAFIRGYQERTWLVFQRECAIVMQTAARRFLAGRERHSKKLVSVLVSSASMSARLKNVAKRIQRWWRNRIRTMKEKEAGLRIERFFIMVKAEVDREIQKREKKNQAKREKRRRKKKEADEKLLERVWLTTVQTDEQEVDAMRQAEEMAAIEQNRRRQRRAAADRNRHSRGQISNSNADEDYRSTIMSHVHHQEQHEGAYHQNEAGHRLPHTSERLDYQIGNGQQDVTRPLRHDESANNSMNDFSQKRAGENNSGSNYPNHEFSFAENDAVLSQAPMASSKPRQQPDIPAQTVDTDTLSDVSGITSPSVFNRMPSRFATFSRKELSDDLSLEEAWIDAEIHQVKEKRRSDDQYLQRHGLTAGSGQRLPSSKLPPNPDQNTPKTRPHSSRSSSRRSRSSGRVDRDSHQQPQYSAEQTAARRRRSRSRQSSRDGHYRSESPHTHMPRT